MYNKELQVAKQAARLAGNFLRPEFFAWKRGQTKYKGPTELVTWCDKKSESIIVNTLNKKFPNYQILSEEGARNKKNSDHFWIIDPLDGTTNFTIHQPMFAVSISLMVKGEIVLAVTYMPILNETYWATINGGAYKNNQRIHVSNKDNIKKSIVAYCHGVGPANTKKAYKVYEHFHDVSTHCRHFGSTCLELAMVAAGNIEGLLVSGAHLWDVAAGSLLVREAGGIVSDWRGKKWTTKSKTILASNRKIHPIFRQHLKKIKLG